MLRSLFKGEDRKPIERLWVEQNKLEEFGMRMLFREAIAALKSESKSPGEEDGHVLWREVHRVVKEKGGKDVFAHQSIHIGSDMEFILPHYINPGFKRGQLGDPVVFNIGWEGGRDRVTRNRPGGAKGELENLIGRESAERAVKMISDMRWRLFETGHGHASPHAAAMLVMEEFPEVPAKLAVALAIWILQYNGDLVPDEQAFALHQRTETHVAGDEVRISVLNLHSAVIGTLLRVFEALGDRKSCKTYRDLDAIARETLTDLKAHRPYFKAQHTQPRDGKWQAFPIGYYMRSSVYKEPLAGPIKEGDHIYVCPFCTLARYGTSVVITRDGWDLDS